MSNPLYRQLNQNAGNPMIQQLINFKKTFTGDPQQIIQNMLNSGKISQSQVNKYAQQANEIYKQMKGLF